MNANQQFLMLFVSGVTFVAGVGGLLYQHIPNNSASHGIALTAAVAGFTANSAIYGTRTSSNMTTGYSTDASSVVATSTPDASVAPDVSSTPATTTPTRYAYKLVSVVDSCTLNKLGKDGWIPVQYGIDPTTGDYLVNGYGRDENCSNPKIYLDFIWILFQKTYQQ